MPAIAPGLSVGCGATAAAALVVDAEVSEVEAVGFAEVGTLEDEELDSAAPGGLDSSGQSCLFGQHATELQTGAQGGYTWPGCNINVDFCASSR